MKVKFSPLSFFLFFFTPLFSCSSVSVQLSGMLLTLFVGSDLVFLEAAAPLEGSQGGK